MNGHFTVGEMSSSHLAHRAHRPRIAGAFRAQATRRQNAMAARAYPHSSGTTR